jgi:hypothetical protein
MNLLKRNIVLLAMMGIFLLKAYSQPSSSQNYVVSNTVKQAGITKEFQVYNLPITTQGKAQAIAYFDGLGRPLQNVITQGSSTRKDIIAPIEYDVFGREVKKYLPYVDGTTNGYGSLKTD